MWRVVLVLIAGCGRFGFAPFGEDDTDSGVHDGASGDGGTDGSEACTTFGPWGTPVDMSSVNTASEDWSAALSGDGLVLVFESNRAGGAGATDLYQATRATTSVTFDSPIRLTTLASSNDDSAPTLSPDGLSIYFSSGRDGINDRLFYATRTSTTQQFSTPMLVSGLTGDNLGPTVSADGTELVYTGGTLGAMVLATGGLGAMTVSRTLTELDSAGDEDCYGSLTGDGLTLYFTSNRTGGDRIHVATRPTRTLTFGAAPELAGLAGPGDATDPEISKDGLTLVFSSSRAGGAGLTDLWITTRACVDP